MAETHRRWFRFRLRSLLLFVGIVAIVMAWIARERRQSQFETEVAEQLQRVDFLIVSSGGPYDSWERSARDEPQGWWRDLARRVLGERILIVWNVPQTFEDAGLLRGLASLKRLNLHGTSVVDLTPLAGDTSLTYLDLGSTEVRDITPLAGLTNVEWLDLGFTQVKDVAPLAGLKRLKSLGLDSTAVDDISALAGLQRLESLNLRECEVTDVSPLARLTNLKKLSLSRSRVSQSQVDALQAALPNCNITYSRLPSLPR